MPANKPTNTRGGLFNSNGNKVPAVKTILGKFQDPSNLLTWAWKLGKAGVTLEEGRKAQDTVGHVSAARAMALLTGELLDLGKIDRETVIATERPLEAFAKWVQDTDAHLIAVERPWVDEKLGFGAMVTTAEVAGERCVFSLKAGKGVYREDVLTVAAEAFLTGLHVACVIRFGKDGGGFDECRRISDEKLDTAEAMFFDILNAYKRLDAVNDVLKGAA